MFESEFEYERYEQQYEQRYQQGYQQGLRDGLLVAIELGMRLRFGNEELIYDLLQQIRYITQAEVLQEIVYLLETTASLSKIWVYVQETPIPTPSIHVRTA
jgi:flagellar biosynthesis/type III secretory pathway protein FliH